MGIQVGMKKGAAIELGLENELVGVLDVVWFGLYMYVCVVCVCAIM